MSEPIDNETATTRSHALFYGLVLALAGAIVLAFSLERKPNQIAAPNHGKRDDILSYAIGYALALALTGAAFAAVHWQSLGAAATLAIVLGLALVQMIVHFRYFLHIGLQKSDRDDLLLILFSTLIVALMISGTLVILFNLRARMM